MSDGWDFLDQLEVQEISGYIVSSVRQIKPSLRDSFAYCCATPLKLLVEDPRNESAWKLLLLIPRLLLQPESRGGQSGRKEVERRFKLFKDEKYGELFQLTKPTGRHRQQNLDQETTRVMSLNPRLVRSVRNKIKSGEISRAASMLTSSAVAEDSEDTLSKLQKKHPVRRNLSTNSMSCSASSTQPLQMPPETFIKCLRDCPNGSSCGNDGWRFEHLKVLLESDLTWDLLFSVCNIILGGLVPDSIMQALAGAKLIALKKNEVDIRPIAVGNCIRRLVARAACSCLKKEMADYLTPHQYGVSTPGGAEVMSHLIQLCLQENENSVILKVDAKNAFNSISRDVILEEVATHFPQLYPFVAKCYVNAIPLVVSINGKYTSIQSEEGVQQGDPLGPFLFSLGLHSVVTKISERHPKVLIPCFLDDSTIIGSKQEVVSAYLDMKDGLATIGLDLREDKCEAYCPSGISGWDLPIPVRDEGMDILGTPVGTDSFVRAKCLDIVKREGDFLVKLPLLDDVQSALLLLRYSAVPKITHLLRTVPPSLMSEAAELHDSMIIKAFENIVGCGTLNGLECMQLGLDIQQGGFGLRSAKHSTSEAFLGGWANTLNHLPRRDDQLGALCDSLLEIHEKEQFRIFKDLTSTLKDLHQSFEDTRKVLPSVTKLPDNPKKLQARLHKAKKAVQFNHVFQQCINSRDQARIHGCGGPNSGAWLDAIPSSHHFTLSNDNIVNAICLRLGKAIPCLQSLDKCNTQCGQQMDIEGYHALTCKWGGGPIHRHDSVLDCYFDLFKSVGFHCRKELTSQFENKQRPDIAIYNYKDGKKLLLDVTITHPLAKRSVNSSSSKPGFAAAEKEKEKDSKYLAKSLDLGYLFRPLALEVYGRWGNKSEETLEEFSKYSLNAFGLPPNEFKLQWRRRIAVCLQKANSSIIKNKVSSIIGKCDGCPNADISIPARYFGSDFT